MLTEDAFPLKPGTRDAWNEHMKKSALKDMLMVPWKTA